MKAAAAAWRAAFWRSAAADPATAFNLIGSRFAARILMALAAAMVACAAAGLTVTLREDGRRAAERHAALAQALEALHDTLGDIDHYDAAQVAILQRRAGLQDLRLDSGARDGTGRDVQSLHDAQGRIIGWLSWLPERGAIRALIWLWGLVGVFALALAAGAMLVSGIIRRLAAALTESLRRVRQLTREDPLTGLPNHRMMLEHLEAALARRQSGTVVLALVDLDGFREVNETHGRAGGDALIRNIAERLQAGLPAGALFGRFEDDEFAVIMSSEDPEAATGLAVGLRAALAAPIVMEQVWHVSAGIGIAQAPTDGSTAEDLSRRAALAVRAGKREGRGVVRRFEPQIETAHAERRFIRRELKTAVAAGALEVHYQPVVAAAGGAVLGVEALARWTHPQRGAIAPSIFIPLAEQSGLMHDLGAFVLRRALADAARWGNLSIAVNVSPLQIRDPKLTDLVAAALAEAGVAPSRLMLEVTEGVLIDDPQETLSRLDALRALGVRLALDDFGTGYSSLSYLQKFPFSQLKIDRAFVAALGTTGTAGAIIQSIVTLGHGLGMKVLAEGVETDEQRVLLRLAGCDEMQGYLFAKPRPADAIDKMLARASAGRAKASPAAAAAAAAS